MEITSIDKYHMNQMKKFQSEIKDGFTPKLTDYFFINSLKQIRKSGYIFIDDNNIAKWFQLKSDAVSYMNSVLNDN
jgi:coproporphyrinogen III oxidase